MTTHAYEQSPLPEIAIPQNDQKALQLKTLGENSSSSITSYFEER